MAAAKFGAKAHNLQLLTEAGFNVPPFFVLPESFRQKLSDKTETKKLKDQFSNWLSDNDAVSVAVRSSSEQEDSAKKSFAGQFKTVLAVQSGSEYIEALAQVFTSKQHDAYSKGTGHINAIVQKFVEPDKSGVIFSINPTNGANELVINVASGRGTNVVDGLEATQVIINRMNLRNFTWVGNGSSDDNLLSESEIIQLSQITLEIEGLFLAPQDVEWAMKDGVIYILQSRPITQISHLKLWDSSNISESFPGIVLPLTFSIARRGYLLGYKSQAYAGGLSWYELEAQHRTFDSMIGIFNGKLYYNLLSWYKFISMFPGSKRNQKFLDDQIATQGETIYQPPAVLRTSFRAKFMILLIYRALFFNFELNRFYSRFKKYEDELLRMPKAGDSQLLIEQYSHIEQKIIPQFGRTVDNDFFVMTYNGLLKRLLQKSLPDQSFERTNIIGSISGVMSAKQALKLYKIAAELKKDPIAIGLLKNEKYSSLEKHLEATDLQKSISEYMEVFGHRFAEDQKIEVKNPTLEPFGMFELLKAYVQLDVDEITKRIKESVENNNKEELATKKQIPITKRYLYSFLLNRLKHHLRLREKNRLLRGKVYGYMRELFPKIGQSFVEEGVIEKIDDIFYLQIEEIYQLFQGTLICNDLTMRIANRRAAYKKFEKIEMPERFITKGIPSLEQVAADTFATTLVSGNDKIAGMVSSPGSVEGIVLVLTEPIIPKEPYDILVASHTDPGWTPLIALSRGVIVEHGGMLSHAAIVTRELGIPSIIGVANASKLLKTGMRVRINTQQSCVEILDPNLE